MNIAISGGCGRMGRECQRVFELLGEDCVFLVDSKESEGKYPLYHSFANIPRELSCDCIIDFSNNLALPSLIDFATKRKIPTVIATTALDENDIDMIKSASKIIPIFLSRNMSIGINILGKICQMLANAIGDDYDIEIVETHHATKKDAPSGTALYLADMISTGFGGGKFVFDRRVLGSRQKGEIGIHSLRGGSVVGEHNIRFLGMGENISLTHYAENREVFARGALAAAKFLLDKKNGLYSMDDLVKKLLLNG